MLNSFLFPENCAVYDMMWNNMVEPERPQMKIRRMRLAYWLRLHTNTQNIFYTDFFFFHGDNSFAKASQYYDIYTSSLLF